MKINAPVLPKNDVALVNNQKHRFLNRIQWTRLKTKFKNTLLLFTTNGNKIYRLYNEAGES